MAERGARIAAVAIAYFCAAKLGIELDVAEGVVTPVWAPTGLALAALLLFGYAVWPAVAVAAFAANATSGIDAATAAGIATGNTLEGVSATYVLRHVAGFRPTLDTARDVLALAIVGGFLSTAVAATIGAGSLLIAGEIEASQYRSTWFLWWFGDAIGALIVAPLVLVWATRTHRALDGRRLLEAGALTVALVALALVVFSGERWHYPYVLFPFLVWAAVRFDVRGAATANFVVTAVAVWATVGGSVLVEDATPTESVQILQSLIAVVGVSMLIAAATVGERTRAEDALSRSLSLLQATLDSTADGVLVVGLDGTVVSFNQRFADMWRIPDEVIERGDDDELQRFVVDQLSNPAAFRARVQELYARPDEESTDVLTFKDGRVFERYSRPQRVGDRTVGRVWSFRDVTEARRSEGLKGRFLDMASHEMRNPLGIVSSLSAVLLQDWETLDDATKQHYVERMGAQSDRLRHLVDALLLTSRVDAGKLEPRLGPLEVVELVRDVAAEHAELAIEIEADRRLIAIADRDYLRNMLANYLSNAEKYGRAPVQITVASREGFAHVCVRDSGHGIPEELVPQLFERFSPTREALNPRAPGTGLGLWIVRELAHVQAGEAWYDPPPEGPRFCFRLPLAD